MKGPSPLRVGRMLRKELRQIFRDPRMKRIIFVAPVIQLVVFGYAVNTDIRDTPLFVVDHSGTAESRRVVDVLTASGYFRVTGRSRRPEDLLRALDRGSAIIGIQIPPAYATDLKAGRPAPVQVLVDGTNSNTATVVQGNAARILRRLSEERLAESPGARPAGVDLRIRAWFNPDLASRVYNVPAVMGVILMLMSLLLTAMTVVREREIGTLEQLMVTPLSPGELILGKTLPVALIALVQLTLITAVAILWFGIPFRGSALALLLAALIYILAGLAFGLIVSTVARTQQEALMVMFLFLLPAIIISGFMFPIFTMPPAFQWLSLANPIRHFLEIVRPVFLKGYGVAELWPSYLWLLAIAATGLVAARVRLSRAFTA
ncbi:MAG TPA: ABC transporter permease [Longimicrobiales bacterium]|nr:ABC transporter permease [Longimicrobiales bacterium]